MRRLKPKTNYEYAKWVGKKILVKGKSTMLRATYSQGFVAEENEVNVGEAYFHEDGIGITIDSLPLNFNGSLSIKLPKEIADTARISIKKSPRKKAVKKKKTKKKWMHA